MFPFGAALRVSRDRTGVDGSWSGNDTIWRTCLDLNRILIYGRVDATLADSPHRRVIHVVGAMTAGQGEGPLAPEPLELGLILVGGNPVAVDYVGALLLGYDPGKIPLIQRAFELTEWPLTSFGPDAVSLVGDWGTGSPERLVGVRTPVQDISYPRGWGDCAASRSPTPGPTDDPRTRLRPGSASATTLY